MKHFKFIVPVLLIIGGGITACRDHSVQFVDIEPTEVLPSTEQLAYQQMEFIGFIHFTINTFTNKEWGYGDEDPSLFDPTQLNVEQWVITASDAGMKQLILTAKHHDGFCLWPSAYTDHDISNSPYKDGRGDVVREFVDACRKHGLKVGLYLSPWDRNHPDYGTAAYLDYYRNQITELLTNYGKISEIWFDGANGGDGYYGGANEVRKIDRKTYYAWDSTFALVKQLQPGILIFSDAGPDIHWIGNEHGFAGETFWSTFNRDSVFIGTPKTGYLNTGDPDGPHWVVGECDVSIRPGWFYHESQDNLVKSPSQLLDIYYKSVGRNATLLLNLPPDTRGLIHETDAASLRSFRSAIDSTFKTNLAAEASISFPESAKGRPGAKSSNLTDGDSRTYWAPDDGVTTASIRIDLPAISRFDRILLQEPIRFGQRIKAFSIEVLVEGQWITLNDGTTIGYKRLIRTNPVETDAIRLTITSAINTVALSEFGLYLSDELH